MDELRSILRTGTAREHARLDGAIGAGPLGRPEHYRRFLAMHGSVLPMLERRLEAAGIGALLPDWHERRRRMALASDLGALGIAAIDDEAVDLGPDETSTAAIAGAAYVLEGSRLGGRVLRKTLPDGDRPAPTAFLDHGIGKPLWPTFVDRLATLDLDEAAADRAVLAARGVFAAYERAFQRAARPVAAFAGA
ncbi:MAG: biliverdin-producing heme oxygenase [Bauldia litoralis]|uniref:biliverdin-producing heme oxygenase n=2 Tax=Bauldia litoralis TaxID=665467 RepID=UPI0032982C93